MIVFAYIFVLLNGAVTFMFLGAVFGLFAKVKPSERKSVKPFMLGVLGLGSLIFILLLAGHYFYELPGDYRLGFYAFSYPFLLILMIAHFIAARFCSGWTAEGIRAIDYPYLLMGSIGLTLKFLGEADGAAELHEMLKSQLGVYIANSMLAAAIAVRLTRTSMEVFHIHNPDAFAARLKAFATTFIRSMALENLKEHSSRKDDDNSQ